MSKLLVEPYYCKSRTAPVWYNSVSMEIIRSIEWGPGYGLAVGDHGTVRISSDGLTWTAIATLATLGSMLNHVLWTGWCWIVCGSETNVTTTFQFAMYSTDTVTWTRIVMPDSANTLLTGSAFDGGTYIFTGRTKSYATTDFVGFTTITNPVNNTCLGIKWLGAYFAIWGDGTGGYSTCLHTLTFNGTSWVFKIRANQVVFNVPNGSVMLLTNGSSATFMCVNGANWYNTQDGGETWSTAITVTPTNFLTGGDGTGPLSRVTNPTAACWNGYEYVVIYGEKRFTSPDGLTWTKDLSRLPEYYTMMVSDGTWLFAYAKQYYFARSSDQGLTWETPYCNPASDAANGSCQNLRSITGTGLGLFAYNATGRMYFSNNAGATWINVGLSNATTPNSYKVWDCGSFSAILCTGKLLATTDGVNWSYNNNAISSPTFTGSSFATVAPYAAAGTGGTVVVVGMTSNIGYIDCSYDGGYTWNKNVTAALGTKLNARFDLHWVSWNGGQFLATGVSRMLYSYDGINWDLAPLPTGTLGTAGSGHHIWTGQNYIMATGANQVITSGDGITWTKVTTGVAAMFVDFASNGGRVIATTASGNPSLGTNLYYTDDYGSTWFPLFVPVNGPVCQLVTCSPWGRFYLTFQTITTISFRMWSDDGANWYTDPMLQTTLNFVRYGTDGTTLYSGNSLAMLKSVDNGYSWAPLYVGYAVAGAVVDNYGKYSLKYLNFVYTSPTGANWVKNTFSGMGSVPQHNTLDYNPNSGVLIAAEGFNSAASTASMRSTDGGTTWTSISTGWGAGSSIVRYLGGTNWFMDSYSGAGYVLLSTDDGNTWSGSFGLGGKPVYDYCIGDVNGVAVTPGGLYTNMAGNYIQTSAVLTYTGLGFGNHCFVAVSTTSSAYSYDDGNTWNIIPHGSAGTSAGQMLWNGTSILSFKTNGSISYLTPPPQIVF